MTNSKFSFYDVKFHWNWFEWSSSYDTCYSNFEKFQPKKSICRKFKQYDSDQFKLDIFNSMPAMITHAAFENNFASLLDKHAPKKTKILWGNQKLRFNKNPRK